MIGRGRIEGRGVILCCCIKKIYKGNNGGSFPKGNDR